jgi:acylphosphatase
MVTQLYFIKSYFSGHVQGVGFRYQVISIAKGFELTGYVKNLNDGRVELLAEGEEAEVTSFLEVIESELDVFIKNVEKETGTGTRLYSKFSILG